MGITELNVSALASTARPLAYLDPGSGSYLLQLLIAGALGALFVLRTFWGRVKSFFRGAQEEDEPADDES